MGTTLLLADDSITIQKVVGIIFANEVANEDYKLFIVDNGDEVLGKAREVHPDVLLIDALMPGKSGYEVCEEIRRDPVLKDTPLLLLVGAFEPFDEAGAKNSGADDYITKPFESQSLIDKVKTLIATARERVPEIPLPAAEAPVETVTSMAPELEAPAEMTANLAEQFRGYIHIGGDSVEPAEQAEPSLEAPTFEPVAVLEPKEEDVNGVILLSSVDVVEAGPDDDPWGSFTEEFTEGEPVRFGEVVEDDHPDAVDTVEEIEPFSFMDEAVEGEPTPLLPRVSEHEELHGEPREDTAVFQEAPVSTGIAGFTSDVRPIALPEEGKIYLGEEPEVPQEGAAYETGAEPAAATEAAEPAHGMTDDGPFHLVLDEEPVPADHGFSLDEVAPEAGLQTQGGLESTPEMPEPAVDIREEPGFRFAPDEAYIPAGEIPSPTAETKAAVETPVEAGGVVTLTEEQLAAAISRVSSEIIEKIVWDVVPDLAEMIIKEEIRKIKEGIKNL